MKKFLCLLCFLIFVKIAYSAVVEVNVSENLKGNITSITYDNSSNLVKFSIEFYNTGSVGYKARIKTEIFNETKLVFTGWTQEKDFAPGEKKSFDVYWYTKKGKYQAKIRIYLGNEIQDYKNFDILISEDIASEDVFDIKDFRTYDNFVIFDINSRKDVKNLIAMPNRYVQGWIFEQKEISSIPENSTKTIVLPYYPTLWSPTTVNLVIVSDKGKYYSERTVEMKKNEGLTGFFFYLIDNLKILFYS